MAPDQRKRSERELLERIATAKEKIAMAESATARLTAREEYEEARTDLLKILRGVTQKP